MIYIQKTIYEQLIGLIVLSIITLGSCSNATVNKNTNFESQQKAVDIIKSSIAFHGGHKAFKNLVKLDFNKQFSLYKSDGSKEFSRTEKHLYLPKQSIFNISWVHDNQQYQNILKRNEYSQSINGKINHQISSSTIQSAIDASVFAFLIPYKLINEGAKLSFEGIETLSDGTEVYVVKASYSPEKNSNHTKSDIWWHFFNKVTKRHEGYKVKLIDHTSLIRNLDYQKINNFIFPSIRKSWRIDEMGKIKYLRAEYDYAVQSAQ